MNFLGLFRRVFSFIPFEMAKLFVLTESHNRNMISIAIEMVERSNTVFRRRQVHYVSLREYSYKKKSSVDMLSISSKYKHTQKNALFTFHSGSCTLRSVSVYMIAMFLRCVGHRWCWKQFQFSRKKIHNDVTFKL